MQTVNYCLPLHVNDVSMALLVMAMAFNLVGSISFFVYKITVALALIHFSISAIFLARRLTFTFLERANDNHAQKLELIRQLEDKNAVIAGQSLTVREGRLLATHQGAIIAMLVQIAKDKSAQLKDARFELELHQWSHKFSKAASLRQEAVATSEYPTMPATPNGSSMGTLSPSSSSSSSIVGIISRSSSISSVRSSASISASDAHDADVLVPLVVAPAIAAPPPAEAMPVAMPGAVAAAVPAVVLHTGPHNRPKRVRRKTGRRGAKANSQKSANKIRMGLSRGYS